MKPMRFIAVTFFLLSGLAFAEEEKFIRSLTAGLINSKSNSELRSSDDKKVLEFKPNVASAYGIFAETKYIGIGYIFSGNQAEQKDWEKSKYLDLRANFTYKMIDVRLNYQNYRGALVEDKGRTEFYRDYEVRAKNARFHYYFNPEHLKYIREGSDLVKRASSNEGHTVSSSLFWGLTIDERTIQLPDNLKPEHQQRVTSSGVTYDRNFSAVSIGPLAGGDIILFKGKAYFRGKLGAGPGFQSSGSTGLLMELGFNVGYAFSAQSLISLGVDVYSIELKNENEKISNANFQTQIAYTHVFGE